MKTQESRKHKNSQGVEIVTNYRDAVNWLHNDYILCNNIADIDQSIYDNMRFDYYIKTCPHCDSNYIELNRDNNYTCSDCKEAFTEPNEDNTIDVYQWYLTSANEFDVKYLEKRFGLLFTYSDLLDVYVLCVDHCGMAWDYVSCQDTEEGK